MKIWFLIAMMFCSIGYGQTTPMPGDPDYFLWMLMMSDQANPIGNQTPIPFMEPPVVPAIPGMNPAIPNPDVERLLFELSEIAMLMEMNTIEITRLDTQIALGLLIQQMLTPLPNQTPGVGSVEYLTLLAADMANMTAKRDALKLQNQWYIEEYNAIYDQLFPPAP